MEAIATVPAANKPSAKVGHTVYAFTENWTRPDQEAKLRMNPAGVEFMIIMSRNCM